MKDRCHCNARSDVEILFLDIETGGLNIKDNILQIAMVGADEDVAFNKYVTPIKPIDPKATAVNGLTNHRGNLYLHGKRVMTLPLKSVLQEMLEFLRNRGRPCVLVAHKCDFDADRLLFRIKNFSLVDEFREVILGFTDTLTWFKEMMPDRGGRGSLKLTTLAKDFLDYSHNEIRANAHDAMYDAQMLKDLVFEFSCYDCVVKQAQNYDYCLNRMEKKYNL